MGEPCVYLVHAVGTNRYKLGYTANPLSQRVQQLSTACPFPLKVVTSCPAQYCDERKMHAYLREFRVHREWFELNETALAIVIGVMEGTESIARWWDIEDGEALEL